ncbi:MAG: glycoside hydrolase family 15 protein [Actinomycetota bacterium]
MGAQAAMTATNQVDIGAHGAIGDCRSVALVTRDGAIDWLCWPMFSSPALFAGLLDPDGGVFRVSPAGPFTATRRYLPDTNVIETTFATPEGRLRLTDFMPVPPAGGPLRPTRELLRLVDAIDGSPTVRVEFAPRPRFAAARPRFQRRGGLGWAVADRGDLVALHTDMALSPRGGALVGEAPLAAGERRVLWMTHSPAEIGVVPPLVLAEARLAETVAWWRGWTAHCTYQGDHGEAVRRSLLALKLLTYAPSGAVVAAATSSLPESPGHDRNWDYRFCWLRDSSLTYRVFNDTGYGEEADRYLRWLVLATRLSAPELQVVYDVYGRTRLTERQLPHLAGWRGSRPVRVGNDAHRQFQLDLYGEAMATVADFVEHGGRLTPLEIALLDGWAGSVEKQWRHPDRGIWEVRTAPRHFTYSKVMAWATFDALARIVARGAAPGGSARVAALRARAGAIARTIERDGFDAERGTYVAVFGEDAVDASLLLLPWFGYVRADSPRMRGTLRRILAELDHGGLIRRYPTGFDGFASREGAFLACGFWAADCLARAGELAEAESRFAALMACGNDLGLFAEEVDPAQGCQLGNTPQAFSHVAVVNAAMTLADVRGQ